MRNGLRTVCLLMAAVGLFSAPASANLITNPGFEAGGFFTGWTGFDNLALSAVDCINGFQGVFPTEGNCQAFFGQTIDSGGTGGILQQVTAGAGQYVVSFDLHNFSGNGPNFFDVSFGGTSLFSCTDCNAFTYSPFSFLVSASANPILAFTFLHDPSFFFWIT